MVQEQGAALELIVGLLQFYIYGLQVNDCVAYPEDILDTAVLCALHSLAKIAEVHLVFLAHIVGSYREGTVVGILVYQETGAAVALIVQGDVEFRSDILGAEQIEVGLFPGGLGKRVAPVRKHGVRRFDIVHRHRLGVV